MIDISYVQKQIEMNKRKELLEKHPYEIWEGKDGKWYTYLPDSKKGRILKKRAEKKEIEDMVVDYYKKEEKRPCFRTVYNQWISEKEKFEEIGKNSITRYNNDFERFFPKTEPFCKIRLCDMTDSELERFIKRTIKAKMLSAKSYAGLRLILIGVFKYAKREGYTDYSISTFFSDLSLPQNIFIRSRKHSRTEVFSENEIKQLVKYLSNNPTLINLGILIQIYTGVRVGELSSLKREDNNQQMVLRISRTEYTYFDKRKGKRTTEVKDFPKTENGIRSIFLPDHAQKILDLAKQLNQDGEYLLMQDGKRITGRMFNYHLQKTCRIIGIPPRSTHKIRKTYGSILLANGMDEAVVLNQMGHKNISTTQGYYHYDITEDMEKQQKINEVVNF